MLDFYDYLVGLSREMVWWLCGLEEVYGIIASALWKQVSNERID